MTAALTENDEPEIAALLVGRRIVAAEFGPFDWKAEDRWVDAPSGRMILDDGTQIYVIPNQGGCSCGAGDYALEHLAAVENVITSVRVVADTETDEYGEGATSYRIFVVADSVEINALQVDGYDGNGYYGTGYELFVVAGAAT